MSSWTEPLLSFIDADVGYVDHAVLSGVRLDVMPGEVVGLVGPNGAGKSTLLKVVTDEAELLGGGVLLGGVDALALDARERARVVGVVPQGVSAAFGFSAKEFVEMGRHPHLGRFQQLGAEDARIVEHALEVTDTARLADRQVDELSGGDLQRLALAQSLAQQPTLLLLDEPVSHLDLNHRLQILDLVRDLARTGIAVLAVFHELDLAARYSDRVAVVARGEVGPALSPHKVITAEAVREVFGVRAVVGTDAVTGSVSVTPVLREQSIARPRGRVHVVGGSGSAAPLMRRLVVDGWEVSAGALNLGDADQVLADALGVTYPLIPPFEPMDDHAVERTQELALAADAIVVADVPFGRGNLANLRAVADAADSGVHVVLIGGIEGRDFCDGEAAQLWERAVAAGALPTEDVEAAVAVVDGDER